MWEGTRLSSSSCLMRQLTWSHVLRYSISKNQISISTLYLACSCFGWASLFWCHLISILSIQKRREILTKSWWRESSTSAEKTSIAQESWETTVQYCLVSFSLDLMSSSKESPMISLKRLQRHMLKAKRNKKISSRSLEFSKHWLKFLKSDIEKISYPESTLCLLISFNQRSRINLWQKVQLFARAK